MALSNIFREPRREIIESVVGIGAFAVAVWADYLFAVWLGAESGKDFALCMGFGVFAALVLMLLAIFTHAVGEGICGALQNRGIHLRPRNRP